MKKKQFLKMTMAVALVASSTVSLPQAVFASSIEGQEIVVTQEVDGGIDESNTDTPEVSGEGVATAPEVAENELVQVNRESNEKKAEEMTTTQLLNSVEKNILPQINGVEDTSVLHGNDFDPLAGISAVDSQGTPLEINVTGIVDTLTMGVYQLTYTATDAQGNTISANRTVTVELNRNEAYVEDSVLKMHLNRAIGKATGTTRPDNAYITQSDALSVTEFKYGTDYRSLEGFQYFKNLKIIEIGNSYWTSEFADLTPLSSLKKLEILKITKYTNIADLTPLSNLHNLKTLWINFAKVKNIGPLKHLPNLEYLNLNNNEIENADVLMEFPKLKQVNLSYNLLTDVSKLASLSLEYLNLDGNQISDTSMFSQVKANNQKITLDVKEKDGVVTIENVVKLPNNQMFVPESISNNGRYLVDSNEIQWKNITTAQTVNYKFKDVGHSGTVYVRVSTDTKPTISGVENFTISVGSQFDPLGRVVASDREDGDLTSKIKVQSSINTNKLGTYPVTYSVTDSDGNTTTAECLVKVDFTVATDWKDSWASTYIERAMEKGWVSTSTAFRPEDNITRAEFVKIVNQAFGFQEQAESEPYEDVKDNQWYYGEILKAVKAGYISVAMTKFRPEDTITREEVAAIITSIQNKKDTDLDKIQQYTDYEEISVWARESVEGVVEAGYMGKGSDKFRPKSPITRAEAVVTLGRIFE